MTTLRPDQIALLVKRAGWPNPVIRGERLHVIMTAVGLAESGGRVEVVNAIGCVGVWQINAPVHRKYDRRRLASDAAYNCRAALEIYRSQGLGAWSAYTNGAWRKHLTAARRGVAQASTVRGNPATPGSGQAAAVRYGPKQSQVISAGQGRPLEGTAESWEPITGLRIMGKSQVGDYSRLVIGNPQFEAGIDVIPHLKFTIVDPWGGTVWRQASILTRGSRVQYKDLNFRIDTTTFAPGGHTTGQLEVTCVDDIAWALMNVRGPRTAQGQGAVHWLAQEMRLAGVPPERYLLGESVPSQSVISRDVPDQSGTTGTGQVASAWTTGVRLAKELGKRFFVSGRRLVFGSAEFAMRWTTSGPLEVTSAHTANRAVGLRMLGIPSLSTVSVGTKGEVQQITFRVPLNRAHYFRPGAPVRVHHVTFVAGEKARTFMVTRVAHNLGVDADGAEITAVVPTELVPEPPRANDPNSRSSASGSYTSGGGADGQVARFVALALEQTGDRYVFGAEAARSDPNPRTFDCCLTVDSMISTSSRGPIPIGEIAPTDTVWCWDGGRLVERKVVAVAEQPTQSVFAVRTRNSLVRASANHPFLVLRRCARRRDERGIWLPVEWRPEWVRVDELVKGDWLVKAERLPEPTRSVTLASGVPVNEDVAWLIGEIIGDGRVHDGGVSIAAFRQEIRDRIRRVANDHWQASSTDHPTHGITIFSSRLRDDLTALGLRVQGPEKRIPDALRTMPWDVTRALLAGYAEADGHFDKRGHQTYSSCSRRLIDDVRALHLALGDRVSNVTTHERRRPIVIKGKTVKNARALHSFATYPDSSRRNTTILTTYGARRALPDLAFTVERVTSVTPAGEETTYDIEVDGAHNYLADGLVVHNSELVEWAAARAGISPRVPDGSAAQKAHCAAHGTLISIEAGIRTKGALLFRPGHVAISLGNGKTIEAMNPSAGVRQGNARGRSWTAAGRIPGAKGYR